jgi:hypothetical protein
MQGAGRGFVQDRRSVPCERWTWFYAGSATLGWTQGAFGRAPEPERPALGTPRVSATGDPDAQRGLRRESRGRNGAPRGLAGLLPLRSGSLR